MNLLLRMISVVFALFLGSSSLWAQDKKEIKVGEPKKKETKPLDLTPIEVPFETIDSQHMVVQVKMNGKGPYRLIFDTGAPFTLINNKVAKEAGVFGNKKPSLFAIFGSQGQFKIDNLEIGELKVEMVETMVMDHPTVSAISKAVGPIEGIVGFNVFAKYKVTLDYQKKKMVFVQSTFVPANMMDKMMVMLMASPAEREKAKVLAPGGILGMIVDKEKTDTDPGVVILEVFSGSSADQAGMKKGDRLLTLDRRWTDSVVDCFVTVQRFQPGTTVLAEILRDGKKIEIKIQVRAGI